MERPTNILVECPALIPSVRLGVLEPLKLVEESGRCIIRFIETKNTTRKDVAWCDIFIPIRGCEPATLAITKAAKKAGRFVACFLDDDLLNIPTNVGSSTYFMDKAIQSSLKGILELCDVLWCVNAFLGEKYRRFCTGRLVLADIPAKASMRSAPKSDRISILYAGSTDHESIVQKYVSPAIRRLCDEYGDNIYVTFIGADPQLGNLPNVCYYKYIENFETYQNVVQNGNFQIGLAPIETSDFYKCKYYNKFFEYSRLGAVGVYTDSEPYALVVRDSVNGILCENSPDAWYAAIKRAIDDEPLRQNCVEKAQTLLVERFSPASITERILRDIPEIDSFRALVKQKNEIAYFNIKFIFYKTHIGILWRKRGIAAIPELVFRAVRKLFRVLTRKSH